MSKVSEFLQKEEKEAITYLRQEILGDPSLSTEENELLGCLAPLLREIMNEIREKLADGDLSNKELEDMYIREQKLKSEMRTKLAGILGRALSDQETELVSKVIKEIENIIIDAWFEF